MPYDISPSAKKTNRRAINISQNNFAKGYVSTFDNSRRPRDTLSDMTNMELVQDGIARPRPPLVLYGTQPAYTVVGRGKYRYNGSRGQLFMLDVGATGAIYSQVDGGAFTLVGGANAYDDEAWAGFVQSKNRVYVFNGVDNLSYINLATMATVEYTALATPDAPTLVAAAGLVSGTKPYNYYYRVTANNAVGESTQSAASSAINVNAIRDNWTAVNSVAVSWTAVAGATSYTIYCGNETDFCLEVITLKGLTTLTYTDDGSQTLNPFKKSPGSNSTEGPIFTWMYVDVRNSQVYGVTADNKLYFSAFAGDGAADFSSLNGGGYTTIDEGGDTQLNFVDGFRTGKGDPIITVSARGAAGKGKLFHFTFDERTYGDQVIEFPNVMEANGQSGTYAPRATVKVGDSFIYPTGDDIKSTGTSQNINNILTTNSIAKMIIPDVDRLSLGSLDKACGVESQSKVYLCLPVGSTENNEIWIVDMIRKNAWTLRWPVAAKDIWLYEDNDGLSHLCVLVSNKILEFTRAGSQTTTDNTVAFKTRCAFSSLIWDKDGLSLGNLNNQFFKLLQPRGNITANAYGLTKRGATKSIGTDTYSVDVSYTGIGQWDYSGDYLYGDDVGAVDTYAKSIAVLTIRPKGLLNQEDWEIITEAAGCDYLLSSVSTRGMSNTDLIYKGLG